MYDILVLVLPAFFTRSLNQTHQLSHTPNIVAFKNTSPPVNRKRTRYEDSEEPEEIIEPHLLAAIKQVTVDTEPQAKEAEK